MLRILVIIVSLLTVSLTHASEFKYSLGLQGGLSRLYGSDEQFYPFQMVYGARFDYRWAERWSLSFSLSRHKLYDDTTSSGSFAVSDAEEHAAVRFKGTRLAALFVRDLVETGRGLDVSVGFGGGLMLWKAVDAAADTVLKVPGTHDELVDFSTSELILTAQTDFIFELTPRLGLTWSFTADYFSHLGAEFRDDVNDARDRWHAGSMLTLTYSFGRPAHVWQRDYEPSPTRSRWTPPPRPTEKDSDGDGVDDEDDRCPHTLRGVGVDRFGCALDTDGDGVKDDRDDCPATDLRARGMVDIHGCPTDSDSDGIPDYLDACPFNAVGALVDSAGCPVDTDADGVPDGLDDCPNTLFGADVDRHGCIELSMLAEPVVLNIDYVPGSFEVDPVNRERLDRLARLLNFVPDVRLEISGYTDNIGTATANRNLSEKRANRVRDFLVAKGVATERIKVFGRGETNFVASNQTAAGRAQNRRVEIIFFR